MPSSIVAPAPEPVVNSVTICNAATMEAGTHRAILQRLNRKVGDNYFPADQFAQSVDMWAGIPNIFANQHPNLNAYDADPEAELKRINGRIVGYVKNPEIVIAGGARLEADEDFGGDPEVEALNLAGKLTGSTAFRCGTLEASISTPPQPHHVLWFPEDLSNRGVDPGVVILNKETYMETITNAGKVVSTANAGKFKSFLAGLTALFKDMTGEDMAAPPDAQTNKAEEAPAIVEVEQTIEAQADPGQTQETDMEKTEYDTQIANKQTEITNKDTEIAGLKTEITNKAEKITELESELTAFKNKAEGEKFQTFLNKIKPAFREKPEQIAELRNKWDTDKTDLLLNLDTMIMNKNGATKETGDENVPIANKAAAGTTVGSKDPVTGVWA